MKLWILTLFAGSDRAKASLNYLLAEPKDELGLKAMHREVAFLI